MLAAGRPGTLALLEICVCGMLVGLLQASSAAATSSGLAHAGITLREEALPTAFALAFEASVVVALGTLETSEIRFTVVVVVVVPSAAVVVVAVAVAGCAPTGEPQGNVVRLFVPDGSVSCGGYSGDVVGCVGVGAIPAG